MKLLTSKFIFRLLTILTLCVALLVLGFALILPSTADAILEAKLSNDKYLICNSFRSKRFLVFNSSSFDLLYDLSEQFTGLDFAWNVEFATSKRSSFLIMQPRKNTPWVLIRLEPDKVKLIPISNFSDLQIIDDFDADQTFIVANDKLTSKRIVFLLSDDQGSLHPTEVTFDEFSSRYAYKFGETIVENETNLPGFDIQLWNINIQASDGPVAFGYRRIIQVGWGGRILKNILVDETGQLSHEAIKPDTKLKFSIYPWIS